VGYKTLIQSINLPDIFVYSTVSSQWFADSVLFGLFSVHRHV